VHLGRACAYLGIFAEHLSTGIAPFVAVGLLDAPGDSQGTWMFLSQSHPYEPESEEDSKQAPP
jgi:hypothetical protein